MTDLVSSWTSFLCSLEPSSKTKEYRPLTILIFLNNNLFTVALLDAFNVLLVAPCDYPMEEEKTTLYQKCFCYVLVPRAEINCVCEKLEQTSVRGVLTPDAGRKWPFVIHPSTTSPHDLGSAMDDWLRRVSGAIMAVELFAVCTRWLVQRSASLVF